ncbi:MAG: O-antigen ligase family protein [Verrucomicrobiota bacterium]
MKSLEKLTTGESSEVGGNRSFFAGLFVMVPLVAALFYGVIGADKFVLISPLVIFGYLCLVLWMLKVLFFRGVVSVAPPGFFLFLLFFIYGAVMVPFAAIPYEAKLRMLLIGLFVGAYYMWGNSLTRFQHSRNVLGLVMLFALLSCFYGLINFFKQPEMVLWVERYAPYVGRLASTYICPNHFAHLLQMLLPFCLAFLFIPQAGWFWRMLSGYCIIAYLPTIVLTESRAGMLGSIAAVGVTACLLALRRSKKLFLLLVVVVPLLSTISLVGAWNYSEMFKRRMEPVVVFLTELQEKGFENAKINDFRPQTWLDTIEMIKEKPATGFGPASYHYVFPEYRTRFTANQVVTGHPHNEYLEMAAEYGLYGFGLFALAWCYGLIRLLVFSLNTPNQHHAFMAMAFVGTAAGTMVHSFFDFQMLIFQNALLFSLLAAIAAGPICGRRQEKLLRQDNVGGAGKLLRPAGGMVLVLLLLAGMLLSLQSFSSAFIRAAALHVEEEQPETAKHYYQQAIKVDPSNWRAYKGIGGVYYRERYYTLEKDEKYRLAQVENDFYADGYLYNSYDPGLVFNYGMACLFLGDEDAGLGLLEEATRLRPFNNEYWWRRGIEQRKLGRYDEALESFKYSLLIQNSAVARANIKWLERRMAEKPAPETPQKPARELSQEEPVTFEMQESPVQKDAALDELHHLMDVR